MRCANKKCRDELKPMSRALFCPACLYIGRCGIFLGGLLVGIAIALLKLLKVI